MPPVSIDRQRLEAEFAADADVIRSLTENGDNPRISRPIDILFVGSPDRIERLEKQIATLGWRHVQLYASDDGNEALEVQSDQTTTPTAIRQLTETALEIAARFGVEYDGWGTVATKR